MMADNVTSDSPWVDHDDYPGLLRCWDASALRPLMQCPRRFYYKQVEGLRPLPRLGAESRVDPHIFFGTTWHECVEHYDKDRIAGRTAEEATERAIERALQLTWEREEEKPWGGEVMSLWTCTGVETKETKTGQKRRKFLCDAARGEWAGDLGVCPKCGRPVVSRSAYIPHHATKNRTNLLRAVLVYCDEQATSGLRPAKLEDGTPALEIRFELDLPLTCPDGRPYVLCGHLDRISEFDGGGGPGVFPHERKTTSRALGRQYWGGFSPDPQIDTYDWAAHRLYLRHEGVIVEAIQIMAGGVRLVRSIITSGPERRAEWESEVHMNILRAEQYARHQNWPRNTASCSSAGGGRPCEFRDVCASAPSSRPLMLERGFERKERWNPIGEI